MRQNGAPHNGEVGIGSDGIMREHHDKFQKTDERSAVNQHRSVLSGEHDAVLVIIDIRRILQIPSFRSQGQWNQAKSLPGRMIRSPRISLILRTEQTLRVGCTSTVLSRRDRLRIFFRLGQVDRHIQVPVFGRNDPLLVLCDPLRPDVIRISCQPVKIICGILRIVLILLPEGFYHL